MAVIGRRWLPLVLLLGASNCREFDVCEPGTPACAPPPPAGLECAAGRQDCDGSTLNGCETDPSSSPAHCGACGQVCNGVCSNATCVPFEVKAPNRDFPMGNFAVTSTHVFFITERWERFSELPESVALERLSREDGTLTTLVEGGWEDIIALAASSTRLYVLGDSELFSLPLTGSELKDEGFVADGVATSGRYVAIASEGQVLLRAADDGEVLAIDGIEYATHVAGTRDFFAIATDASVGDQLAYELFVHRVYDGETTRFAAGPGEVTQVSVVNDVGFAVVYYSVLFDSGETRLFVVQEGSEESPAPVELMVLPDVTHWVVVEELPSPFFGEAGIVASYETESNDFGLRFLALEDGRYFEWPTAGPVLGLTTAGSDLFFVDNFQRAVVQVDLGDMVLPRFGAPLGARP